MDTNKDNRVHDRDEELQNKDRDQKQQDRDLRENKQSVDDEKDKIDPQNPGRLQDKDHKMNQRTNEVQGEVDYEPRNREPHRNNDNEMEDRWKTIENDYRKRYPDITDEDVRFESGNFPQMTERIAKRTNRSREDVAREIKGWQGPNQDR